MEGRSLRSSAGVGQEEEEEESGDEEEEGEKDTFPSWKKTIMIGPSYQASVPSGTTNYDDRFAKQAVFLFCWNHEFDVMQQCHISYKSDVKKIYFQPSL